MSPKKELFFSVLAVLIVASIGVLIYLSPNASPDTVVIVPPAGNITVRGQMICLPHRNTRGPQTLECAFGVVDGEGRYFGLRDSDAMYRNLSGVPTNVPVEVRGVFTPREDIKYKSIGVIEVTSVARADIPQRAELSGEFLCLPHIDTAGPQTEECAFGLKTDDGIYYAIDFGAMSQTVPAELKSGVRISASGVMVPIEQLSTDHWQRYPIKGIFSVTDSLKILEEDSSPRPLSQ